MVLDGNSIINRAYYGVRPLTTRDGFFTHAIFGFLTMLGRLLDEEKPEALCVAFDRREPTFRHLEYEGYKATRHAMPEELAMQMPMLKDVLDALNIPRYELAGFEADDLIGTISRKCESAGWDCVVATGDKDSLQLVTEHTTVKLISTRMGQTTTKDMTPESFREVYGFAPIHIVDLNALMGDACRALAKRRRWRSSRNTRASTKFTGCSPISRPNRTSSKSSPRARRAHARASTSRPS